ALHARARQGDAEGLDPDRAVQLRRRGWRAVHLERQHRGLHGNAAGAHGGAGRPDPRRVMGLIWYAGAALWGVAEATLFFIVPDVLITFAVVRFGLRRGLVLAVVAAASASVAGVGMWWW